MGGMSGGSTGCDCGWFKDFWIRGCCIVGNSRIGCRVVWVEGICDGWDNSWW